MTWHYNTVEDNAKSEAIRKKLYLTRDSLAKETNQTVLNQMLVLRNKIALRLGYKSWDDFQTEIKMAKTGAGAKSYIDNLIKGIQPKFAAEVAEMQKMKAEDTHDPNALVVGGLQVLLDRVGGIDDERLARRGVADQVGGAAEIVVDELAKQHVPEGNTGSR